MKHSEHKCILTPREQLKPVCLGALFPALHQVGAVTDRAPWLHTAAGNQPCYLQKERKKKKTGTPICTGAVLSCAILVN